jgi:hypothetical protein
VTVSAILTPPIGIAIGLGIGALYAYTAFKGKSRASFASEFRSWLNEQCNQTQAIVNTSFQRELIDLQEEVRRLLMDATSERERDIAASLAEARTLMQTEQKRQQGATRSLQERRSALHNLQRQVTNVLSELTAGRAGGGVGDKETPKPAPTPG